MKQIALSQLSDDLPKYLRLAEREEITITRRGKPAGILIGFRSEDEWLEYKLEHDPRFIKRVERARARFKRGEGKRLEDIEA